MIRWLVSFTLHRLATLLVVYLVVDAYVRTHGRGEGLAAAITEALNQLKAIRTALE